MFVLVFSYFLKLSLILHLHLFTQHIIIHSTLRYNTHTAGTQQKASHSHPSEECSVRPILNILSQLFQMIDVECCISSFRFLPFASSKTEHHLSSTKAAKKKYIRPGTHQCIVTCTYLINTKCLLIERHFLVVAG